MSQEDKLKSMLQPGSSMTDRAAALRMLLEPKGRAGILVREDEITLTDLAMTAHTLIDGGMWAGQVSDWLCATNDSLDGRRPVEVVSIEPMEVLAAAHGAILDRDQTRAIQADSRPRLDAWSGDASN